MPSVTAPGLSTDPGGVTSLVPSLSLIAVPVGSTLSIRPSTAFSFPGAGVAAPGDGELRPAGGGTCVWASAPATRSAGASIATSNANVFMCQTLVPRDVSVLVVRLSPDHEAGTVGVLLDIDDRVRQRLGYFAVDEQYPAPVVLDDLVIVSFGVRKDPQARIRVADP